MTKGTKKALTPEDARAQSVLRTHAYLDAHSVMDANSAPGLWYTTTATDIEPFKDWHMVRLVKSIPLYKSTAYIFHQKGYAFAYDILPTLRCTGFEKDGELGNMESGGNAMYMLCPDDTYKLLQEDRFRKMQENETRIRQSLGANLRNQPGLSNLEISEKPL